METEEASGPAFSPCGVAAPNDEDGDFASLGVVEGADHGLRNKSGMMGVVLAAAPVRDGMTSVLLTVGCGAFLALTLVEGGGGSDGDVVGLLLLLLLGGEEGRCKNAKR